MRPTASQYGCRPGPRRIRWIRAVRASGSCRGARRRAARPRRAIDPGIGPHVSPGGPVPRRGRPSGRTASLRTRILQPAEPVARGRPRARAAPSIHRASALPYRNRSRSQAWDQCWEGIWDSASTLWGTGVRPARNCARSQATVSGARSAAGSPSTRPPR